MAESVCHSEEPVKDRSSASVFETSEEDDHGVVTEEVEGRTHHK